MKLCDLACYFSKVLFEVQHPVQAHARVLWSLQHMAPVIDKHVQFPFSFFMIELIGDINCLDHTPYMSVPMVLTRMVMSLSLWTYAALGWPGRQHKRYRCSTASLRGIGVTLRKQ